MSRVDIDEPGYAGTHGWQVRYRGLNAFFSDSRFGRKGSPVLALAAAKDYLAGVYQGPNARIRNKPAASKKNQELEAGIREMRTKKPNRNVAEVYIEALSPRHGVSPRRFYVGTEGTVTPLRYSLALAQARLARQAMVREHLAEQARRGWV